MRLATSWEFLSDVLTELRTNLHLAGPTRERPTTPRYSRS